MKKAWVAAIALVAAPAAIEAQEAPVEPATIADASAVAQPACAPGIYLLKDPGNPASAQQLAMSLTEHRKVSGLIGFALTGGIAGMKVKTVLIGASAAVRTTEAKPVFLFCFDVPVERIADPATIGSAYVGAIKTAASPTDYALVRFDSSKKSRELAVAKTGFGSISGALSDSIVRIRVKREAPGAFRVTPDQPLPVGEYGFFRTAEGGAPGILTRSQREQVFDFGVDPANASGEVGGTAKR